MVFDCLLVLEQRLRLKPEVLPHWLRQRRRGSPALEEKETGGRRDSETDGPAAVKHPDRQGGGEDAE